MPPRHRLTRADFAHMRGFRRLKGVFFSLSYGTLPSRRFPGGACVVASKIASRAVDRNRIKRRARSILLPFLRHKPSSGVFVLYAAKGAVRASFRDTEEDISTLLERAARALA